MAFRHGPCSDVVGGRYRRGHGEDARGADLLVSADSRCRSGSGDAPAAGRGARSRRARVDARPARSRGRAVDGAADRCDARRRRATGADRVPRGRSRARRGLVPASVTLLAGEPGIGKSTLLLHLVAHLASQGHDCLLVSGEESHAQVAARARRLGIPGDAVRFAPGRDLEHVLQTARAERPFLLAVDSIQTIRDTSGTQMPGGVSQVRTCTDALVGLAKAEGVAVLLTGHVTKDGDLAGPRALEHAVDVVLTLRRRPAVGAARARRWQESVRRRRRERLVRDEPRAGSARSTRRALLVSGERSARRGDRARAVRSPRPRRRGAGARRVAPRARPAARRPGSTLDGSSWSRPCSTGPPASRSARSELFGASSGGVKVDDPACDLGVAAALASAATGAAPPAQVRLRRRGVPDRARAPGARRWRSGSRPLAPPASPPSSPRRARSRIEGVRVVPVRHVAEALSWVAASA